MARVTIKVTPEKLVELLGELPPEQLKMVLQKVAERLEIREWMRLGESGFREWLNEPDLYADDRPARRCRPGQIPLHRPQRGETQAGGRPSNSRR